MVEKYELEDGNYPAFSPFSNKQIVCDLFSLLRKKLTSNRHNGKVIIKTLIKALNIASFEFPIPIKNESKLYIITYA